ncbi:histidine ammonia-lyase [Ahniella affigens]|uniref:Histidine ammonia-lyase n=1 Tax=Ahniella affigens TaxID=2021234 RepID=A0A2P1PMR6_9GAMM|nr:aromatic amino acid lyase [Ahniella affigens]AVP96128.1 histidine ammonia-lyase [Ahniella affigens]
MRPIIELNGLSLSRSQVAALADGAAVHLAPDALERVAHAASFLSEQVRRQEPIYGVTTGFGSNADKLLGARRARDDLPGGNPEQHERDLLEELQHNLVITHAVCVGEPFPETVVRAMLGIRINTLLRGHSGIRVETLQALAELLNRDVIPVIPRKGSVGASGDLAPLSHLAMVLLGEGEAFVGGLRKSGREALQEVGLQPVRLSFKEGLALNNGTTQMLATGALALNRLEHLLQLAELAAAMTLEAFAGRSGALVDDVHQLRPHPGQIHSAKAVRALIEGSTLVDIAYHLVPRFSSWLADSWQTPAAQAQRFDISWDYVPPSQRHGRENFYKRFLPFKGGKKHQPQDAYCLRCMPQVHGAVRDAFDQACRVFDVELNAVTDNPLVFPDRAAREIEDQVISAGHFHGMPLALAMSYVKAAIPVLASISERRLNKLVDPATNDGLPAFLIGNEDATDSGFMIVQYTAAALVNDLASRAHPASVYSIPTSANAEDHVSMGANEARHVLDMLEDLEHVLALELYTAAQALEYRRDMLNAARELGRSGNVSALISKIRNAPRTDAVERAQFESEVAALAQALAESDDFQPSKRVQRAFERIRQHIPFMAMDRAMDGDIRAILKLVASGSLLEDAA